MSDMQHHVNALKVVLTELIRDGYALENRDGSRIGYIDVIVDPDKHETWTNVMSDGEVEA